MKLGFQEGYRWNSNGLTIMNTTLYYGNKLVLMDWWDTDDVIVKVSQSAIEHPEIKELDINPLLVFPKGVKVADALLVQEQEAKDS